MKKFFESFIVLSFEVILLILFTIWFVCEKGFEPLIGMIASSATILTSLFFRSKKDKEDKSIEINHSKNVNTGNIKTKGGSVRFGDDNQN